MLETHVLMLSVSAKISIIVDFGRDWKISWFQVRPTRHL